MIFPAANGRMAAVVSAVILAGALTATSTPASASTSVSIAPTDSAIEYVGRWDTSSPTQYESHWGGAYFTTAFSGPTINIELGGAVDLMVQVDGEDERLVAAAMGVVELAPVNLDGGDHVIRVAARFHSDSILFQGLEIGTGEAFAPPPHHAPKLEFIGDSITAGYTTTGGAVSDYAWLAGEHLEARHTQIAYTGICLTPAVSCITGVAPSMSEQFDKLETVTTPLPTAWDFSQYQPDVVVI